MTNALQTPLLDQVNLPADLRRLKASEVRQLADELRAEVISAVGVTGGHLGSGLGVVELTAAIHYVFDTPRDKLVWDVGHQCYPHKILTGRRDRIRTLRQGGGLSGFTKRAESEYDPFGAAHSSTSISAALGFAIANKLADKPGKAIAVIGDGAMSAGMAYEAMNNAEAAGNRLVVILNDNDMSIAPPVGGLSAYLSRIVSSREFLGLRDLAKKVAKRLPRSLQSAAKKTDEYARGMTMGGTLFEELGFYYVGPIDGHNLDHLIPVLENVRDAEEGPILVHVVTKKGKGLRTRRAGGGQVSRRAEVRRRLRDTGEGPAGAARLPERVRGSAGQGSGIRSAHLRDHRGDAVGYGAGCVPGGVPGPLLRRRHRRAARGDVRGGSCSTGDAAVLRNLLDVPAARL